MGRIHLFEIEDQDWCPRSLRDAVTDNLQFGLRWFGHYASVGRRLVEALERDPSGRIIDLCSGGGGPWLTLAPLLEREGRCVRICLTDRFPNLAAFRRIRASLDGRIEFRAEPVDARRVPDELDGLRTLFTAFHHFRPEDARAILADAVRTRRPIAVFEVNRRRPFAVLLAVLASVLPLLFAPFIRPFRWSRLVWTYPVPLLSVVALWDGVVSCLRAYSVAELSALTAGLANEDYTWEIGLQRVGQRFVPVTFLIGRPSPTSR